MLRHILPVLAFAFLTLATAHAALAEEITVYTALEDDQIPAYLASFKTKHPDITVKIVRDSTGVVTAKLLAEKDSPQADVVWGLAATSLLVLDQHTLLSAYAPKGLERINPLFRDARTPPTWIGIDAWETAFITNTVEAKNRKVAAPASYADLIKPEYRGMLTMPNPASSGTGFLTVAGVLQLMGEEKGWAYLDALHLNMAAYTHSGSKPAKMAAKGECVIGISFGYRGIKQKNGGDPIDVTFPTEGSGWDLEANALIKKAQIKPGAKTFLDWAISDEPMKEYAKNYPIVSAAVADAKLPAGYPSDPLKQLIKNDFAWAASNRDRILGEWSKRYDGKSEPKK